MPKMPAKNPDSAPTATSISASSTNSAGLSPVIIIPAYASGYEFPEALPINSQRHQCCDRRGTHDQASPECIQRWFILDRQREAAGEQSRRGESQGASQPIVGAAAGIGGPMDGPCARGGVE